jgi:predicted ArsR family transcriptional regulator
MKSEEFLKSDEVKVKIVRHLRDGKWHSYYELQKGLGINYESLKQHMKFLAMIDLVELSTVEPKDSKTGRGSYRAKITGKGMELLASLPGQG